MADPDAVDEVIAQWTRERPDLELAAMATFGRLGRVHVWGTRALEAVFERHGLNTGEFDVLATLRRAGSPYALTPGELARSMMLSPGGMTNRIDRLEASGWVRREADPDDRRSLRVVLTEEGRALIDTAVTDHVNNEEHLLGALTQKQRAALDDALRALLRSLADGTPDA